MVFSHRPQRCHLDDLQKAPRALLLQSALRVVGDCIIRSGISHEVFQYLGKSLYLMYLYYHWVVCYGYRPVTRFIFSTPSRRSR